MTTQLTYFNNFRNENGNNWFSNEYDFESNQFPNLAQNEMYFCFESKPIVQNEMKPSIPETPLADYEFAQDCYKTEKWDITSMKCENEEPAKIRYEHHSQEGTNSTLEVDTSSEKSLKKGYEDLFLMVEDKHLYKIGNENDSLTTSNNKDLVNLDKIISDKETDLNNFIEDMLKNCPCDNLIKKQRIYKAKNIKRKRKTKTQIKTLEKELQRNPTWLKDDFKRLSEELSLNRDQVYKWYWDQKKKSDF
eukprot:CAMPEP_0196995182 /NCGR_PEP_ID=MMETSP1380-20130617/1361_1 /TAXON_ID=5936 /ORGANISM="Euplotes crassus, Strain CT5" /LENGTH=247 /DNA_ID=CAMNT_0042410789 /DNA_START=20 /DNA_END=763 /DNA_ORIENTATION=-